MARRDGMHATPDRCGSWDGAGLMLFVEAFCAVGLTTILLIQGLILFPTHAPVIHCASMLCSVHLAHHLAGVGKLYRLSRTVRWAAQAAAGCVALYASMFSRCVLRTQHCHINTHRLLHTPFLPAP